MRIPTNTQEAKKALRNSMGTEIEYVGQEAEDAAVPKSSFIVVQNNVHVYLMVANDWLETMNEKQVALRLKCVVKYGTETKRNVAKELLDSFSEFELWFDKRLPDSAIAPFSKYSTDSNRFFKREFDDNGVALRLNVCGLDETVPVETWVGRDTETFQKILGKILLDRDR